MIALDDSYRYRKRHSWSPFTAILDVADYQIGYILSLPFLKIIKVKISKVMESPKYVTFVKLFGVEYHKI
jgi:hypothetical protein